MAQEILMNRTLVIVGVLVVLVILGVALMQSRKTSLSTQQNQTPTTEKTVTSQPTNSPSGEPSGAMKESTTKEFTVTGQNFSFSLDQITVNKGDKVKITFKNSGGTHDFIIDELHVASKRISTGEEDTVEFTADKTGEFEYYCSVDNHRQMGMKGTLTVK